jgi:peptidoglycan-associated lipoprotein
MKKKHIVPAIIALLPLLGLAGEAAAQRAPVVDPIDNPRVRFPDAVQQMPAPPGAEPLLPPLPVLKADFVAKAGSDTVQFGQDAWGLDDSARSTLNAQAAWLRANPLVRANIEGHADGRMTREHALALGERRAESVRSYLLALGIPPYQLSTTSWGKERPAVGGAHEATFLQNSRVVTVLVRPEPTAFPVGPTPPPTWDE